MKNLIKHLPKPAVDYRGLRTSGLRAPEYRHLWLLLFWPIYWLRYPLIEAINTPDRCYVVSCALDEFIPFCEYFLIPYMLWMGCMLAMALYTALYDVESFKKYHWFLILTFSASTIIYLIWPTCQNLRPETFARDNLFTRIVGLLYAVDTSTNVCPSEHVIGSIAFLTAAFHTKSLRSPGKLTAVSVMALLTSLSTVFLKQHSFVDVLAALPVCAAAFLLVYKPGRFGKPVRRPGSAELTTPPDCL